MIHAVRSQGRGAPRETEGLAREDPRRAQRRRRERGGLRSVRRRGVGDAEEQRGDEQHRGRRERVRGVQRAGGRGDGARGTVGQRGRMTRLDESLRERRCSGLKKSKPSCVSRFLGGRYAEGCSSIRGTCQRDSGRSSRFPISRLQRTVNRLVKVAVGKTFAKSKKTWSPFRASDWMRPRHCHPHKFSGAELTPP